MKGSIVVVLIVVALCCGCGPQSSESVQLVPFELSDLESLPVGLEVIHTPNPVSARTDGNSGYKYTWTFKTSVCSTDGPVAIYDFGCLMWKNDQWVLGNFTKELFTQKDFIEWYSCPSGVVTSSSQFSDLSNWGAANCLGASKSKWFYVGIDDKGNRVKGEAIIEQAAELVE